jgi:hypothetical protein
MVLYASGSIPGGDPVWSIRFLMQHSAKDFYDNLKLDVDTTIMVYKIETLK